jgi:macrolide-specific efflux system membrane fusion protein
VAVHRFKMDVSLSESDIGSVKTGQAATVTVQTGGKQVTRSVDVGLTGDSSVQIVSGLNAGDQVVVRSTVVTQTSTQTQGALAGRTGLGGGLGGGGFGGGGFGGARPGGFGGGGFRGAGG